MSKLITWLKELWFKENEIKVYLCLLEYWEQPASIIWNKTWISRSNTQYICKILSEKWIITFHDSKTWNIYKAAKPEKIIYMLNREYNKIDKKMQTAKSIMDDLNSIWNAKKEEAPTVRYFSGLEWMKELFEDTLVEGKDITGFIYVPDNIDANLSKFLFSSLAPRRKKLWIKANALVNECKFLEWLKKNSTETWRDLRWIPSSEYPIKTAISIYWDKVSFADVRAGHLNWVIIESKIIAQTQHTAFKAIWDKAKKID